MDSILDGKARFLGEFILNAVKGSIDDCCRISLTRGLDHA